MRAFATAASAIAVTCVLGWSPVARAEASAGAYAGAPPVSALPAAATAGAKADSDAKPDGEAKAVSASAPAHGVDATRQASGEPAPVMVEVHGYVQPAFGARNRPQALPRDRWEYGGLSSRAGLIVSGTPAKDFGYVVHLSLDARALLVLTEVSLIDTQADGNVDGLRLLYRPATGTLFEEVSVTYKPFSSWVSLRMGAMRMPFTVALRSSNTALMFVGRPGPNEVFQSGADLGGLVLAEPLEGRIRASLGAFTGFSLNPDELSTSNTARFAASTRGLVWSARVDANPLGQLPQAEVDFDHASVRFGVGVGALYRNGTVFSAQGYELMEYRDVRLSGSVRFAAAGFFVQAEALRRLVTDNLSARPSQSSGAYAQASYYVPVTRGVGLAPLARVGITDQEEATLSRRTTFLEGGLALFPRADQPKPESVRVLVQYQGERRTTDDESAHAVLSQVQILF